MTRPVDVFPSAEKLQATFDTPSALTLGLEEEVMLLDAHTLDLLPRAGDVLMRLRGDDAVKDEMPASQLELITPVSASVGEAAKALYAARCRLAAAAEGVGVLAAAGVHPFAAPEGELNLEETYEAPRREYGRMARRQLVAGLHVHVAVRPADRALAVYNALRSYLPQLGALAANSPFHAGADTGLQSMRPKIAEALPRQGVPPAINSFGELAEAWRWGARAGSLASPRQWWWELRPHPYWGTIEVRVCDAQSTVAHTAALAAVIHTLCAWLVERHDRAELPAPADTWRIQENRWSACRYGVAGTQADLVSGERRPTRELLAALLTELAATAERLDCSTELAAANALIHSPLSERHRVVSARAGPRGLVEWLARQFLDGLPT